MRSDGDFDYRELTPEQWAELKQCITRERACCPRTKPAGPIPTRPRILAIGRHSVALLELHGGQLVGGL